MWNLYDGGVSYLIFENISNLDSLNARKNLIIQIEYKIQTHFSQS